MEFVRQLNLWSVSLSSQPLFAWRPALPSMRLAFLSITLSMPVALSVSHFMVASSTSLHQLMKLAALISALVLLLKPFADLALLLLCAFIMVRLVGSPFFVSAIASFTLHAMPLKAAESAEAPCLPSGQPTRSELPAEFVLAGRWRCAH